MKDEIIIQLEPLLNKPIWFRNEQVTLTRYEFKDDRERVFFYFKERGELDRPYDSAHVLIEEFKLVPQETNKPSSVSVAIPGQAPISMPFLDNGDVMDKITQLLLQDIDDIKSGELDLEKAEARGKNIDKIIEIEKTKVQKATVMAKFLGK
ncbi:MAG: hypothetical protein WC756_12070 [Taibaiella sp.]|jgi:hypothetical protein